MKPKQTKASMTRRSKKESKAQLIANSPKPSTRAEREYVVALRRVATQWEKATKSLLLAEAKRLTSGVRLDAKDPTPDAKKASKAIKAKLSAQAAKLAKAKSVGTALDKTVKVENASSVKEFINLGINLQKNPRLGPLFGQWRKDNVSYITRMLEGEAESMADLLAKSEGRRFENVAKDIEERFGMTKKRAELIARDQAIKLSANIRDERATKSGLKEYIWVTRQDDRVRDSHKLLHGKKFSYDDHPPSGVYGEKQAPGVAISCRCLSRPVIPALV